MILTALLLSLVATAAPQKYDAQINGAISAEGLAETLTQLKVAYDANKPEALIYFNSPGGDAIAMLMFIGQAEDLKKYGMKFHCVADGMIASAASIIYEALCDQRDITPTTLVLFHEAAGGVGGKETNIEDGLALIKAIDIAAAEKVAPALKLTVEEYRAHVKGRDWWMPGADAVNINHAADKLVHHKDTPTLLPPPGQKEKADSLVLPKPFNTPEHSDEKVAPEPTETQDVGGLPLSKLGAVKHWLESRDWQVTMAYVSYGLIGLLMLVLWIKAASDKRKAKKQWLAAREARLKAEDEARMLAANLAMAEAAKKAIKPKRTKKN